MNVDLSRSLTQCEQECFRILLYRTETRNPVDILLSKSWCWWCSLFQILILCEWGASKSIFSNKTVRDGVGCGPPARWCIAAARHGLDCGALARPQFESGSLVLHFPAISWSHSGEIHSIRLTSLGFSFQGLGFMTSFCAFKLQKQWYVFQNSIKAVSEFVKITAVVRSHEPALHQ